jgi:hypothetical protein
LSEKQTPQPVEKTENAMEIMEPKEADIRLLKQVLVCLNRTATDGPENKY